MHGHVRDQLRHRWQSGELRELAQQPVGVGLGQRGRSECRDRDRLARLGDDREVDGELVRGVRCPRLPCGHDLFDGDVGPPRLHACGQRLRDGGELQRGDDSELSAARTAERPEQLRLVRIVAVHHAAVGQYDLCSDQAIAGQSVLSSEQADAAAEREAGDADGRSAPGRQCPAVRVQRGVDLSQAGAGADRRDAVGGHGDVVQLGEVEHDSVGRRTSGEAMPTPTHRESFPGGRRVRHNGDDVRG